MTGKDLKYLFGNLAILQEGSMLMDIHQRQKTFLPIAMFGNIIFFWLLFNSVLPRNCEYLYTDDDILDADAVLFYLHGVGN